MKRFVCCSCLALVVGLVGCGGPMTSAPARKVALPAETPITVVTLASLESGVTPEGADVPMVVADDVVVGGEVLVPKGTPVFGKVLRSRKANLLTLVANQPARLDIEPGSGLLPDGVRLPLKGGLGDEASLSLSRDLAGTARAGMEALLNDQSTRDALKGLAEAVESGDLGRLADQPDSQRALKESLDRLGVRDSGALLEPEQMRRADGALKSLRGGRLLDLATGDATLALGAALELAQLAGDVGKGLARKLDAPNIRLPVGTKLTLYTVERTEVRAISRPSA